MVQLHPHQKQPHELVVVSGLDVLKTMHVSLKPSDGYIEEPGDKRKTTCDECGMHMYRSSLKHHKSSVHRKYKPFLCESCDFACSLQNTLKRHVSRYHNDNPDVFSCDLCDYNAISKSNLKKHRFSVHEQIKPFQCVLCEFGYGTKVALDRHVLTIHSKPRSHQCELCQFRCSTSEILRRHVSAIHQNNKPYECVHCQFRCGMSWSLKRHIASKHEHEHESKSEFLEDYLKWFDRENF